MKAKDVIHLLFLLLGFGATAFLGGRMSVKQAGIETIVERVDTLFIRDTFTVIEPKYITRKVVDSVIVPVTEYIVDKDTVFVTMAREQVTWEDSLARVYASGILPQVDSVVHFREVEVITRLLPVDVPAKWGIGIQGGVGVGKGGLTPYVGLGVSYNFLSW